MNAPIDRSRYVVLPKATGLRQLAVARLLRRHKPKSATVEVEEADKQLRVAIDEVKAGRVVRQLERSGSSTPAEDRELDQFVDALFVAAIERIEHYRVFARPAAARLAAIQTDPPFDFEARMKQAEQAELIHRKLFGDARLEFTKYKYLEQSEHMDTLWAIIEQEDYEPALRKLCGDDFYGALAASKPVYAAMTEQRELRQRGSKVNLRQLHDQLQRRMQNYLIAVLAMIEDDDPDNVARIRAALRPIDALREHLERERARTAPSGGEADEDEDVAELIAEEQAVAQEESAELEQATQN